MTSQNPSTMAAAFPIACLTPTNSVPTRTYLTTIQAELNSDAMSIASTTCPTYGHLVLTVTPATYAGYGANAFPAPANPGLNPVIAANPTGPQISEANRVHLLQRSHYDTYHAADKSLRKLVLDAVPNIYLDAVKHDTLGFGQCTTLVLMDHLWDTYGFIDDDQLAANLEKIKAPWAPPTPIENLFTQLKDCQAFSVLGNDGITDASKIRTGVALIEATPFFAQSCREWRAKSPVNKTYVNFQTHFRQADKEYARQDPTSTQSGYHYAHHAAIPAPYSNLYDLNDFPPDLPDLTNSSASEQSILTTPTAFAAAVAAASNIAPAFQGLSIQDQISAAVTAATAAKRNTNSDDWKLPPEGGWGYCHSHGRLRSKNHTSQNCKNCKPGHKKEATLSNKMGGETGIWRDRNFK